MKARKLSIQTGDDVALFESVRACILFHMLVQSGADASVAWKCDPSLPKLFQSCDRPIEIR